MADTIFFCPDIRNHPQLPEQESHHCIKVLRMKEGDNIYVTDGQGFFYECTLTESHPKHCTIKINRKTGKPKTWHFDLHIAFAPTKQMERNEWFIEKATETGTDRFIPVRCLFSERKEIKTERLEKIIVSAMKQSKQAVLPRMDEMIRFDDLILQPFNGRKFIAHCHDLPKAPLTHLYKKGENALILIGPEGDFSEEEVSKAIVYGFEPVSLGENRLRTETACFSAIHTIHIINSIL